MERRSGSTRTYAALDGRRRRATPWLEKRNGATACRAIDSLASRKLMVHLSAHYAGQGAETGMTTVTSFETVFATRERIERNRMLVRSWLYAVILVLFALVMVGGATRVTDSGLSITEWKPIHGVIPPLSGAQWQ